MYFLYRNCPFLVLMDLANETAKYIFPSRRFEARTLEEALMSGIYIPFSIVRVLIMWRGF